MDDIKEFLSWLKERYHIAMPHVHSRGCRSDKGKLICEYSRGELQPTKMDSETLIKLFVNSIAEKQKDV